MGEPRKSRIERFDETKLLYDPRVHVGIYTHELACWSDHVVDWAFETYASDIRVARRLVKTVVWLTWHTASGLRSDDEQFFSVSLRELARDMHGSKTTAKEALDRLLLAGRFAHLQNLGIQPVMTAIAPSGKSRRKGPHAACFQPLAFWRTGDAEADETLSGIGLGNHYYAASAPAPTGPTKSEDIDPVMMGQSLPTGSTSRATGPTSSPTGSGCPGNLDPFTPFTFFVDDDSGGRTRMAAFRSAAAWRLSAAGSSCAITVPELDANASVDDAISHIKKELANGRIALPRQ